MVQSYYDNAGLYRKYGPDKATAKVAGEYHQNGKLHEIELKILPATLTQTETILDDTVQLPAGARIQEVEVVTVTAAATGTAIDLGLIRSDRTTELDYDGLLAAMPLANMDAAGETGIYRKSVTVPTGLTGTGALVGTTLANNGYISASMTDATAFTAGDLRITVRYFVP